MVDFPRFYVGWLGKYAPTWQKNMSSSTESISLHPPDDLLVSNLPIWTNIEAKDFTLC